MKTWYADCYLGFAGGHKSFGPGIRFYDKAVDKVTIFSGSKNGGVQQEVTAVSISDEAFGLLMWENCRDKWIACMDWRKDDSTKAYPPFDKYNTDTHKYHVAKWSDSKTGQVAGGGWEPEAYTRMNQLQKMVAKLRKKDQKDGFIRYQCLLDLVRDKHDISEDAPTKKRKRKVSTVAPKVYESVVMYDSEAEMAMSEVDSDSDSDDDHTVCTEIDNKNGETLPPLDGNAIGDETLPPLNAGTLDLGDLEDSEEV